MNMVGTEKSSKLHKLALNTVARERAIFKIAGGQVEYFSGLQDSLIEDAYLQLKSGQSLEDRAKQAVEIMEKRVSEIEAMVKRVGA